MAASLAETFHPLEGFSDEAPTSDIIRGTIPDIGPEPLPVRDHATLTFVDGPLSGGIVTLKPGASVILGRGSSAQVRVPEESVSREHAAIRWDGSGYIIESIGSSRTWVNGWRVEGWRALPAGARIQLGSQVRLRFDLHDAREQQVLAGLFEAAMRDALTGAYTRRYLRERLHAELSYSSRHCTPVALCMLDLDHFKDVNDRFGHQTGDAVLRVVTAQLKRMLRPEDVLVRYGGEEFCILLRGLSGRNALLLAERLRRAVSRLRIPLNNEHVRITVSIGVSAAEPGSVTPTPAELIKRADAALYRAKDEGRDRSCLDDKSPR